MTMQLAVLLCSVYLYAQPGIHDFRPAIVSEHPTVGDITEILKFVIVGTVVLLIIRLIRIPLRYFIDFAVFISIFYLAEMFLRDDAIALAAGIVLVALRQLQNVLLFNLTSALSIIGFGLLFGLFLPTELVLLLIAAMSIYDVIGVFYTRHIKYIWLGRVGFNPRWRNTLGIVFPEGSHFSLVGSGDFALPLVLTASAATENLVGSVILAGFATVGFFALQSYASRTKKTKETGVPGIPILALFCALGVLLAKAAGLVG